MDESSQQNNSKSRLLRALLFSTAIAAVASSVLWTFWYKEIRRIKSIEIEQINLSLLPDGIYRGSFETPYTVYTVDVHIRDHAITCINSDTGQNFLTYYDRAASGYPG